MRVTDARGRRLTRLVLCLCLTLSLPAHVTAKETVLASIGKPNGDASDLAACSYSFLPAAFPSDPSFRVATSDAATDWPDIHPGPDDAWGGSKTHSCTGPGSLDSFRSCSRGRLHLRADLTRRAMAMARGSLRGKDLDGTDIEPLGVPSLASDETDAIVAFLETLTDERTLYQRAPFDHPQIFVPNGHPGNSFSTIDADGDGLADDLMVVIPAVGAAGGDPLPGFLEGVFGP